MKEKARTTHRKRAVRRVNRPSTATSQNDSSRLSGGRHHRVIDAHFHLFNSALPPHAHVAGVQRANASLEEAVAALRKGDVEKVFMMTHPSTDIGAKIPAEVDPRQSFPFCSEEYKLQTWRAHRELFCWFTDHVDPSRAGYLDDLQRDLEMGADGVKLMPALHGFLPDNPGFLPVYALCRKLNKPVILDGSYRDMVKHLPPHRETPERQLLVRSIKTYVATVANVLRSYPTVAFSLAHTGTASVVSDYDEIYNLIAGHPNAYCDTAAVTGYVGQCNGYNATWLEDLKRSVGAGRIMYGTDWPYWDVGIDAYLKGSRRWTIIADECPNLSKAEKQMILADNADRFLKNEMPVLDLNLAPFASRAHDLHRDNVVIVTHDHNPIVADAPKMLAGGVTGKCWQAIVDVDPAIGYEASVRKREGWYAAAMQSLVDARRAIAAEPNRLLHCTSAADFLNAKKDGKIGILLGAEGAKLLEGRIERLDSLYRAGLRELQLTWAIPNQIVERSGPTGEGLTTFGKEVVRRCNRLGIIVCLTHIPERAFFEAVDITEKPPILSHDAFSDKGLSGVGERELRALASRRGLIGVHFYSTYLGVAPCPERVVDQISRIANVAGIETVALGCDFFPTDELWVGLQRSQGAKDEDIAWAVRGISQIQQVTEAMLARGFSEEAIGAVLGGNYLRVCREVFGS